MKCIIIPIIPIILISCNGQALQNKPSKQSDENWELVSHTFSSNTYTVNGLLDTTFEKTFVYNDGNLLDSLNTINVRRYNKNNLISNRGYLVYEDGKNELTNETLNNYDEKGNLKLSIKKVGSLETKIANEFNKVGTLIQTTTIFQNDTTIAHFDYDENGNLVKNTISDTKGIIKETIHNQYSGRQKISSLGINPNGDTISILNSQRDGKLIKRINISTEFGLVDTTWFDGKNIVKTISHNDKMKSKSKSIYKYNNKGDQIESISYK
jgi:hypothetical protein